MSFLLKKIGGTTSRIRYGNGMSRHPLSIPGTAGHPPFVPPHPRVAEMSPKKRVICGRLGASHTRPSIPKTSGFRLSTCPQGTQRIINHCINFPFFTIFKGMQFQLKKIMTCIRSIISFYVKNNHNGQTQHATHLIESYNIK